MGAAATTNRGQKKGFDEQVQETFKLFTFYDPNATVTAEDVADAQMFWDLVVNDKTPEFLRVKEDPSFEKYSCLSWFYDVFYDVSAEMDSEAMKLYRDNLRVQISALVSMITMSLQTFKAENIQEKVTATMSKLAVGHNKRGVRSYQYAIVGVVLIKTFQKCMGPEHACRVTEVWAKMFSMMLKVLIPAAIKVEDAQDAEQQTPQETHNAPRPKEANPSISISTELKLKENLAEDKPLLDGLTVTKKLIVCKTLENENLKRVSSSCIERPPAEEAATGNVTPAEPNTADVVAEIEGTNIVSPTAAE